jgi:60 kDa SS-A/Ro ribonucleoprotein
MSRTSNIPQTFSLKTFENGPTARPLSIEQQLRKAVLTCLLWEKEFYKTGDATADRIKVLASSLPFEKVADLCVEARTKYKLRHVPLWLLVSVVESGHKGSQISDLIAQTIQRPDEMTELVSLYWKNGKRPLTKQLKVGLAKAFGKFNEYSLAKFDKPGSITLRDVMFLSHPEPASLERADLYKRIANKQMSTPDTWETQLSGGADKKATWIRLIGEQKLGAQALLMNLRNMQEAGVHADVIRTALLNANVERVLPYQFITAARYAKQFEPELQALMLKCLEGSPKLHGQTTLLIDHSGSMNEKLSGKGELTRFDAACGLAILTREVCPNVRVFTFDQTDPKEIPPRNGFALRDALQAGHFGGTSLGNAVAWCNKNVAADRLVVFTDEESADAVPGPKGKGYMINVSTYEHTVGIGNWVRVAGFSEAIVDFIQVLEAQ